MRWVFILDLDATSKGRVGEFFAAYVLESYGVETHRVDTRYSDLWCRVGESVRTVEVKSCTRPTGYKSGEVLRYTFNVRSRKHGWFCLVALDRQMVLLRSVEEMGGPKTLRVGPEEFNAVNQRRTIERFIES